MKQAPSDEEGAIGYGGKVEGGEESIMVGPNQFSQITNIYHKVVKVNSKMCDVQSVGRR